MEGADRILVVEDDAETRHLLTHYLNENGCQAQGVANGAAMWQMLNADNAIDLLILDLMLPGEDGLSLCRHLSVTPRTADIPIIMLTARASEVDRIVGLEMGADDYLAKPFNPRELLARIKSVLRRSRAMPRSQFPREPKEYRFSGWTLTLANQRLLAADGVEVPITRGEFQLLLIFLQHPEEILDRDQLMEAYRDREATVFDRTLDVQVGRLRKRLGDDSHEPRLIRTVWGKGYMLVGDVVGQ